MTVTTLRALFLSAALASLVLAQGCKRESSSDDASSAGSPGPAVTDSGQSAGVAASPAAFTPSRETPELAAKSIKALTLAGYDPAFLEPFIDPSQKWPEQQGGPAIGGVPAFIGAALIYYSRLETLLDAVRERFGEDAAQRVEGSGLYFQVDFIGNGVRELFSSHEVRQLNQIGQMAYVAPLDEQGDQLGYSLVFRENQGEWLWLMLEANDPWTTSRISTLTGLVGKPLRDRGPVIARGMDRIAERVRAGEIESVDGVIEEVQALVDEPG